MKARIPALTKSQQKAYEQEAKRYVPAEWDKLKSAVTQRIVRRALKVACVALHNIEGYGPQRLERFINECGKIIAEIDTDPLLLEHIDQLLIDKYDMKWGERDYTENDKEFFGRYKNGEFLLFSLDKWCAVLYSINGTEVFCRTLLCFHLKDLSARLWLRGLFTIYIEKR